MNGKIDYNELIGEGEKGMVSVFQETWNEGEAKGIIEWGMTLDFPRRIF